MKLYLTLTLTVCLTWVQSAFSCSAPDSELFLAHDRLVLNTDLIVLARATDLKPQKKGREALLDEVEFEILEVLKGSENTKILTLKGFSNSNDQTDFDRHNSLEFWGNSLAGNASHFPDCKTYGHYESNNVYLIYQGSTNFKGHERIIDIEKDRWLSLTRFMINMEKTRNKKRNEMDGSVEPPIR